MARPRSTWTAERIARAQELYAAGGTWEDVAAKLSKECGYYISANNLKVQLTRAHNGPSENKDHDARDRRQKSDFAALKREDFAVGVGNVGHVDKAAGAEKRQEFTYEQGEYLELLRESRGDPRKMPKPEAEKSAAYIALLSEQERRFQNRRIARSASIYAANEGLGLRMMMQLAQDYFTDKVTPAGYALKKSDPKRERTACILLSDLHFGSEMRAMDNPERYTAEEESRRFAKVVAEVSEYKPQYRDKTRLLVLANGDIIDGQLGWDMRDGAPLREQMAAALCYFQHAIGIWAAIYPTVHIEWQAGNHGRDKMRHPGRATSSKWDGHEWWLGYTLMQMTKGLKNVTWSVPFRAVSSVKLYDAWLLMTHGDTEVRLGDPDTKAKENAAELAKVNSNRIYGHEYAVAAAGHYHKGRYFPWKAMSAIFNPALVPPNGYARSAGFTNEKNGQYMWEAVEGYPVGDLRLIEVGKSEDKDASLNKIVPAFRFTA